MTLALWAAFGAALASCLLHAAIGLGRPPAWRHLSFAALMAFTAAYFIGQQQSYAARSAEAIIAIERRQFCVSAGIVAALAWFARVYTGVRIPRRWLVVFHGVIVAFVVASFLSPYGGFLGSWPALVRARGIGGEEITRFSAVIGPLQGAWLIFVAAFLSTCMAMGVQLARRGARRRGVVFTSAMALMLALPAAEVVRGVVGLDMPPLGALGVLILALTMSIDLAVDLRIQETELEDRNAKLAHMLEDLLAFRDQLNTPLQTLELDLALLADADTPGATRVARLRRALHRVAELGRGLQRSDATFVARTR